MKMISSTRTTSTSGVTFIWGAMRPAVPAPTFMAMALLRFLLVDSERNAREADLAGELEYLAGAAVGDAVVGLQYELRLGSLLVLRLEARFQLVLGDDVA